MEVENRPRHGHHGGELSRFESGRRLNFANREERLGGIRLRSKPRQPTVVEGFEGLALLRGWRAAERSREDRVELLIETSRLVKNILRECPCRLDKDRVV